MVAVRVTKTVAEGLKAIRSLGILDGLDHTEAIRVLVRKGYPQAAEWVYKNPKTYFRFVLKGLSISLLNDTDETEIRGE